MQGYNDEHIEINNVTFHLGVQDDVENVFFADTANEYILNDCVSFQDQECLGILDSYKLSKDSLGVRSCIIVVAKTFPERKLLGVELYIRKDCVQDFTITKSSAVLVDETTMDIGHQKYLHKLYYVPEGRVAMACISYCFWYERLDMNVLPLEGN